VHHNQAASSNWPHLASRVASQLDNHFSILHLDGFSELCPSQPSSPFPWCQPGAPICIVAPTWLRCRDAGSACRSSLPVTSFTTPPGFYFLRCKRVNWQIFSFSSEQSYNHQPHLISEENGKHLSSTGNPRSTLWLVLSVSANKPCKLARPPFDNEHCTSSRTLKIAFTNLISPHSGSLCSDLSWLCISGLLFDTSYPTPDPVPDRCGFGGSRAHSVSCLVLTTLALDPYSPFRYRTEAGLRRLSRGLGP
jgi:hypothetical protein